ncbi:macrolide 2'-phosphotransferase [Paenibacillus sp. FJAT-26967]|uniref:macrolide 2'-phosphotransferase n=1 Tax=Paenibacillus sp. FJAT-26967 TaxID=1729690 RepID=UPI0008381ED7|nr:macrolide 2'-phosphotransferase [Paenibacillus sp. FJAT-26967]
MTNFPLNGNQTMIQAMLDLAKEHGLTLNPESAELNESGMDFLVVFAADAAGTVWVLRKPRRDDVWERAENEHKVLKLVRRHLPIQVPDWRIFTPELIAYPLVEGNPVATVDPAGAGYSWLYEQHSLNNIFFDSLAEALSGLHGVDHKNAAEAGIRIKTPQEARQAFAANIEEIKSEFTIPVKLYERWMRWLSTDSYWPQHSVFNHGDLHPPHILVDETHRVTGFLDWTEAEIGDPGKDFVIYYALFGEEGLLDLLGRYEKAGGKVWPRMHEHIAEQWAAYPAIVAKFALVTGTESNMEMARGMLANWNV